LKTRSRFRVEWLHFSISTFDAERPMFDVLVFTKVSISVFGGRKGLAVTRWFRRLR
jgi:hypothetical protein